jgi:hypothetical protein
MKGSTREKLGILLGILLGVLFMSWPLVSQLGEVLTSARADGDLGYTLSAHSWAGDIWSGSATFPFNEKVYFPAGQNMAGSVWNFVVLLGSAWPHLFASPLSAYQIGLLWLMLLNGLAAALLGHRLGGKWGAWGAACAILAFPYPWLEAFEGRLEQSFLAPILLVFWAAIDLKSNRETNGRLLGALMALVGACYWYHAPIAAIGLLVFFGKELRQKHLQKQLGESLLFCGLFVLPFLLLIGPALNGGAYDNAIQDAQHVLFTRVGNSVNPWEVFSGELGAAHLGRCLPIGMILGLVLAWRVHPQTRLWIGLIATGLVFAMGPAFSMDTAPSLVGGRLIPLPFAVLDWLPGMSRFWWPYRFLSLVGVGAAAGLALLFSRLPSNRRAHLALALSAVLFMEGRFLVSKATKAGDTTIPASVWDPAPQGRFFTFKLPEWMKNPPESGAILEFPMAEAANAAPLYAPFHKLPTAHGDGVREAHIRPPSFQPTIQSNRLFSSWAENLLPDVDPQSVDAMVELGFRYILVHKTPEADSAIAERTKGIVRRLEAGLGKASHTEDALIVFDLLPTTPK